MKSYLFCPKCGVKTFFVTHPNGNKIFFHVDREYNPFPTDFAPADLSELDFSTIYCRSCSWSGSIKSLVNTIYR